MVMSSLARVQCAKGERRILPRVVESSKFPLWDHVNMFVNLSTISFKNMFVKVSAML